MPLFFKAYVQKLFLALLFLQLTYVFSADISSFPPKQSEYSTLIRYPNIKSLNFSDPVYKQYSQEVSENYKLLARDEIVNATIYTYTVGEHDNLLAIAARCNIPYESIVTLNNIAFIDSVIKGKTIFIPSAAGLFIAEIPSTPLEFLLKTRYSNISEYNEYSLTTGVFSYIPNAKLSPTERTFFTDSAMIPPLEIGDISSSFGTRISPFTGEETFHNGTDIAAPIGTPVFASKSGVVAYTGRDYIYGNYIIIEHDNNTQSLYAHLDTTLVAKGDVKEKGVQIGTVGNTGLSTGPHLHFEIKIGRRAQDPESLIKNFLQ